MADSLYIHVPFCKRKCLYCDFYSILYDRTKAASYVEILLKQLGSLKGPFRTIYMGGGTPTALDKDLFESLLKGIARFLADSPEFTVEANPESLAEDKIRLMRDSGVNRLSIGVQSFDDRKLKRLGRTHSAGRAKESVLAASKRGFKNLSVDLIFGVWGEGMAAWKKDLEEAARLPITHISCYSLTYAKGTPLFEAVKNGSVKPLEDEMACGMYETAIDLLSLRGFKQYEVSNFARPGFESRHNMSCWENNEYIGVGPSAVSYIDGERIKNISDVKKYIRHFETGLSLAESSERLSPIERARETAAVKIRTREGIDFKWFKERTGVDFLKLEERGLPKLLDEGLIKYKKEDNVPSGICLKRKGFLFCDTVSSALL